MDYPQLTFEQPDRKVFKNLDLAYLAMDAQGTAACALNAANEEAVAAFLDRKISFLEIGQLNEQCMHSITNVLNPSYEDYVATDAQARAYVQAQLAK
jgi:1-deoxy-D-xylulose-5-phosphate reductoisomerase